jgi:hypothetical protein
MSKPTTINAHKKKDGSYGMRTNKERLAIAAMPGLRFLGRVAAKRGLGFLTGATLMAAASVGSMYVAFNQMSKDHVSLRGTLSMAIAPFTDPAYNTAPVTPRPEVISANLLKPSTIQ